MLASIKSAAKRLAGQVMSYYSGNLPGQIPGKFPFPPYYWWESGAAWGVCSPLLSSYFMTDRWLQAMIDYWHYTGDETWNDMLTSGLLWQSGDKFNYMPGNESKSLVRILRCWGG